MIPFEFEYYRPSTLWEAAAMFYNASERGKTPVYYGGGTELISMARAGNMLFGTVIDVKNIPELRVCKTDGEHLVLGAALTLDEIKESGVFPLLGKCSGRIADHTMQCKITLGGNLKSTIIYRESALALLLADARITIAGTDGMTTYSFDKVFPLNLPPGNLIVRVSIPKKYLNSQYFHIKKTKNEKIDYPLVTVAGLVDSSKKLRAAFSGLTKYPFRDKKAEIFLNDRKRSSAERADAFCEALSSVIRDDTSSSRGYRRFVLKNTVLNMLENVEECLN